MMRESCLIDLGETAEAVAVAALAQGAMIAC